MLRGAALEWFHANLLPGELQPIRPLLAETARENPDPVMRAVAARVPAMTASGEGE